jgi:hypothetical protein
VYCPRERILALSPVRNVGKGVSEQYNWQYTDPHAYC